MNKQNFLFGLFLIFLGLSCEPDTTPRPKGYFKIDLPKKAYQVFDKASYPYTFEYPTYATVMKDSVFFNRPNQNPYWVDILFPQFNATIHVSYKPITHADSLQKMINDAFSLTNQHSIKASSIDEIPIKASDDAKGFLFDVSGNAATGKQFYLTDSTSHFIRGALYFEATPNYDSIKPVEEFLYKDILHLIKTFRWKNR
jgi:gliding motility-associated lipoprotein GldD